MSKDFAVNYDDSHGFDYDEVFDTLREAMYRYNRIIAPYKDLTFDHPEKGTVTLLNSKGDNNLRRFGFLPCDYN